MLCLVLVAACPGILAAQSPCGRTNLVSLTWQQLLRKTWTDVTRQIDITLRHHERQHYDALYEGVQTVSRGRGYVPAWIPGKGDVNSLKWITLTQYQFGSYLPKLHIDLERFAIIFKDVARGDNPTLRYMMISTQRYLEQLQRQVEIALVSLQIGVPSRRARHMTMTLQDTPDSASRVSRNWTVLNKYRRYLRQWVKLYCTGARKQKRRKTKTSKRYKNWKKISNQSYMHTCGKEL